MCKCKVVVLSLIMILYSCTTLAECDDPSGQLETIACLSETVKAADKKLNATYRSVLASSDKERQDLIRKSQRAWIKFRDENCMAYYDMTRSKDNSLHGSMAGQLLAECQLKMTEERTAELGRIDPME